MQVKYRMARVRARVFALVKGLPSRCYAGWSSQFTVERDCFIPRYFARGRKINLFYC